MIKIKKQETIDCIAIGKRAGALLLALYFGNQLRAIGQTSFRSLSTAGEFPSLAKPIQRSINLENLWIPDGLRGWIRGAGSSWKPLTPTVCEVAIDHLEGRRLRHFARFVRWRPDKDPWECNVAELPLKRNATTAKEKIR